MAENKFAKANQEIAETVVGSYKKIEEGVVSCCKKIEEGVVGGFARMTDKFVGEFLIKDGETVEEAKARLAAEQMAREEASKAEGEKRATKAEAGQYPHKS